MCVGCSAVVGCLPVWVWVFSGFGEWLWWAVEGFFWVLMFVVDGGGERSDLGFDFFFLFGLVGMDILVVVEGGGDGFQVVVVGCEVGGCCG